MMLKGRDEQAYPRLHVINVVHVHRGWLRGVTGRDQVS